MGRSGWEPNSMDKFQITCTSCLVYISPFEEELAKNNNYYAKTVD
jgi:hypothetical protein